MILKKLFKILFIVFIFKIYFSLPLFAGLRSEEALMVRVAIFENVDKVKLYIPGKYIGYAPYTNEILLPLDENLLTTVFPTTQGIKLDYKSYKIFGLKISLLSKLFYINNLPFKGEVLILRDKNKKLLIINYINLSDYLKGVLYNEVSHWWPMEALKAQAVTARTFALYQCIKNQNKEFDVSAGVESQVYRGKNSERFRTNLAIKATTNKILTYKNKIIPAFYHACCGGYTEDSENLWGIDLPVLDGVIGNFCKKSPHFNWQTKLSESEITREFENSKYEIGKIKNIFVLNRSNSNRINNIYITGEKDSLLISGYEFRRVLGYQVIKSTNFKVLRNNDNFEFSGYGWGHGVGMCQWGAYYMARRGYNYTQILNYYYPGVKVVSIDKIER